MVRQATDDLLLSMAGEQKKTARVASGGLGLLWSRLGVELAGDAVEDVRDVAADRGQRQDRDDGDEGDDQAVLNHRLALLVFALVVGENVVPADHHAQDHFV